MSRENFSTKFLALMYFQEHDSYIFNDVDWKKWRRSRLPPWVGLLSWRIANNCLPMTDVLKKRNNPVKMGCCFMVKMNLYDYFGNVLWHQHRCMRIGIMAPTDFVHNVLDWDHIFSSKISNDLLTCLVIWDSIWFFWNMSRFEQNEISRLMTYFELFEWGEIRLFLWFILFGPF